MMTRAVSRILPLLLLSMLAMAAELDMLPNERTLKLVRDRFGGEAVERMKQWRELVSDARALNDPEKLDRVNRFFNRIPNISDDAHWQQRDYWATPVQLLATNGGDCEDFALAKYFSLHSAGVRHTRAYLQMQLQNHAQDAATTLAMQLGPVLAANDQAGMENIVDTQNDSGYYQRIRLLPLETPSGRAEAQSGWRMLGAVEVTSHPNHAYGQL